MMSLLCSLVLFLGVAFFLAWPIAARLALEPAEKIVTSAALSLAGAYLISWGIYVFDLPLRAYWALPVLTVCGLFFDRGALVAVLRDREARLLGGCQLLVLAWCVSWLGLVISNSGGGWTGDWIEHWERARFFLERWPSDFRFLGIYPLTARPPLVNVLTGAFLYLGRADFATHQLTLTALSSLAFLPAALLARRWANRPQAIPLVAILFMLNPLFVQNATFGWTKLPTAFFVLAALYFLLRARGLADAVLFSVCLAAGTLAHYSTGPYLVIFAAIWLARGAQQRFDAPWRHMTSIAALAGIAFLATWFGWALHVYGIKGTLLTNTTVVDQATTLTEQASKVAGNLRDTLVPFFLRPMDTTLIAQRSPWGLWRDRFFQLYQLNLFFAYGSVAWVAILHLLIRRRSTATRNERWFWGSFVLGAIALGVGVHGGRDTWGLTPICLQPLVLIGLAFLAGAWNTLAPAWRRLLVAGATVDFALGIALHFAVQNFALDRWFTPDRPPLEWYMSYSEYAQMNLRAKWVQHVNFFGEILAPFSHWFLVLLAAALALAIWARQREASREIGGSDNAV